MASGTDSLLAGTRDGMSHLSSGARAGTMHGAALHTHSAAGSTATRVSASAATTVQAFNDGSDTPGWDWSPADPCEPPAGCHPASGTRDRSDEPCWAGEVQPGMTPVAAAVAGRAFWLCGRSKHSAGSGRSAAAAAAGQKGVAKGRAAGVAMGRAVPQPLPSLYNRPLGGPIVALPELGQWAAAGEGGVMGPLVTAEPPFDGQGPAGRMCRL